MVQEQAVVVPLRLTLKTVVERPERPDGFVAINLYLPPTFQQVTPAQKTQVVYIDTRRKRGQPRLGLKPAAALVELYMGDIAAMAIARLAAKVPVRL